MLAPEFDDRGMVDPPDPHEKLPRDERTPEKEDETTYRAEHEIDYEPEDDL